MSIEQSVDLATLDAQATARRSLPIRERLNTLRDALAQQRQAQLGGWTPAQRHVWVVFEEVFWGCDHLYERTEAMQRWCAHFNTPGTVPAVLKYEVEKQANEMHWVIGRLEVLRAILQQTTMASTD